MKLNQKEYQPIIRKYFTDHEMHKKYLAVFLVLSMLVSLTVSMGLMQPAISMTGDNTTEVTPTPLADLKTPREELMILNSNGGEGANEVDGKVYSPGEADLITLIFGEGENLEWAKNAETIQDALDAAQDQYFLGMASDFCAFIEGDFKATDADAEGRVAVGGDLLFDPTPEHPERKWNYQIGSGDYGSMTPLPETGDYKGESGFATALVGGKMYRINTMSTGRGHYRPMKGDDKNYVDGREGYHTVNSGNKDGYTVYFLPEEGLYKSFVLGNVRDSEHYDADMDEDKPYGTGCHHDYPGDCGEGCQHDYLASVNELAQIYEYPEIKDIIFEAFAQVRSRSANLAEHQGTVVKSDNSEITFEGPGKDANVKTVYFTVNSWNDFTKIIFKGIPEGANIIVNCSETNLSGDKLRPNDDNSPTYHSLKNDVYTEINEKPISKQGDDLTTNNNEKSSRILYNFYNATGKFYLNGNFNGTILAPNADVESSKDQAGHLSGALIAKSFVGNLEFGYRPYRGGSDILGLTSGYSVPVDKFISDSDDKLSGAEFSVKNSKSKNIFQWISNGETRYVPLPSLIDFSGNTEYKVKDGQISLNDNGVKKEYELGETLDLSELTAALKCKYVHGSVDPVTVFNGNPFDEKSPFTVTVESNILEDKGDGTYTFIHASDNNQMITVKITCDERYADVYKVPVGQREKSIDLWVKVNPQLESSELSLNRLNINVEYTLNDTVDLNGLIASIKGTYNYGRFANETENGTQVKTIKSEKPFIDNSTFDVSVVSVDGDFLESTDQSGKYKFTSASDDEQTFTITVKCSDADVAEYLIDNQKVDDSYTVTVKPIHSSEIRLVSDINRTDYIKGDKLDFSDLRVFLKYGSDYGVGNEKTFTETMESVNPFDESEIFKVEVSDDKGLLTKNSDDGNYTFSYADKNVDKITFTIKCTSEYEKYKIALITYDLNNVKVEPTYTSTFNHQSFYLSEYKLGDKLDENTLNNLKGQVYLNYSADYGKNEETGDVYYSPNSELIKIEIEDNDKIFEDAGNGIYTFIKASDSPLKFVLKVSCADPKYNAEEATFDVEVTVKPIIDSYKLTLNTDKSFKTKYTVGETLDLTGLTAILTPVYDYGNEEKKDGTPSEIPYPWNDSRFEVSPSNNSQLNEAGNITITVSYRDASNVNANVKVEVIEPATEPPTEPPTETPTEAATESETTASTDETSDTEAPAPQNALLYGPVYMSLNALAASPVEVPIPWQEFVETYKIEETNAPDGFFKGNVHYVVTVIESLNLDSVLEYERETASENTKKYFPIDYEVSIEIKKVGEENPETFDTINLKIKDEYEEENGKLKHRTITDKETNEVFTLTIDASDANEQKILEVKHGENSIIESGSEALKREQLILNDKYYYNPNVMMIMPLPKKGDTQTNLRYDNTPGLVFMKKDNSNHLLPGATIELSAGKRAENGDYIVDTDKENITWNTVDTSPTWNQNENSSKIIDVSLLEEYSLNGTIYRFREEAPPAYYLSAPDIYFWKETEDNEVYIYYSTDINDKNPTVLNLNEQREIEMIDERQYGLKLKLEKYMYKEGSNTGMDFDHDKLSNAVFSIYAEDGTLVYEGIDVGADGEIDLGTLFKKNGLHTMYIGDGYLRPGLYYLLETKMPVHPDFGTNGDTFDNPGKIYFEVKETGTGYTIEEYEEFDPDIIQDLPLYYERSGNNYLYFKLEENGKYLNDGDKNNGAIIPNVVSFKIVLNSDKPFAQFYATADKDVFVGYEHKFGDGADDSKKQTLNLVKVEGNQYTIEYIYNEPVEFDNLKFQSWWDSAPIPKSIESAVIELKNGSKYYLDCPPPEPKEADEPLLNIDTNQDSSDAILQIANKPEDGFTDISINKNWAGDFDFPEMRPNNVTVQLYRTTNPLELGENGKWNLNDAQIYDINAYNDDVAKGLVKDGGSGNPALPAVLNKDNNWSVTYKGLPSRYKGEDGKFHPFFYYIQEVAVSEKYDDSYSIAPDGTLIVTNTLKTLDINLKKIWNTKGIVLKDTIPNSVVLTLQWNRGTAEAPIWEDVPNRTITLKKGDKLEHLVDENGKPITGKEDYWYFTGTIKGLPPGYEYRISEPNAPSGWRPNGDGSDPKKDLESDDKYGPSHTYEGIDDQHVLSIVNVPDLGKLKIIKDWAGDTGRPDKVNFLLYRAIRKLWPEKETKTEVLEDYARLLQYSLYFYDGVMCGDDVAEKSAYYWRGDCHAYPDKPEELNDVNETYKDATPGGYHDAGDHVMFGLPSGFSASNVGWHLYEYRDECDELGQTPHMKVIMDHYAEYFERSVHYDPDDGSISELLVQKGHGNTDHKYWGIPEGQKADQYYGSYGNDPTIRTERWVSNTGSDIAAEYAAALALSYLNFYDSTDDPDEKAVYREYLELAKKLYTFAYDKGSCFNEVGWNKDERDPENSYYVSDSYKDDLAWAAVWLAVATTQPYYENPNPTQPDHDYKADAKSLAESFKDKQGRENGWNGHHWNNVINGARAAYAAHLGKTSGDWQKVVSAINFDWNKLSYESTNAWGNSRYNAGWQTIALVAAKYQKLHEENPNDNDYPAIGNGNYTVKIDDKDVTRNGINYEAIYNWCQSQMNYILGDNNAGGDGVCFVTNFAENSVKRPHYRAGSGQVFDMKIKDDVTVIDGYNYDRNRLIGGLVGGTLSKDIGNQPDEKANEASYKDVRSDFKLNEVASDYNANLIGAAAGLYHFFGTGRTYEIPGVKIQYLSSNPDKVYNEDEFVDITTKPNTEETTTTEETTEPVEEAAPVSFMTFNPLSLAMKNSISVLAAEVTTGENSFSFTNIPVNESIPIPEQYLGNAINKIVVEYTDAQYAGFQVYLNGSTLCDKSNIPSAGNETFTSNINNSFDVMHSAPPISNKSIESIKINYWNCKISKVTFYFVPEVSLKTDKTEYAIGEKITPIPSNLEEPISYSQSSEDGGEVTIDEENITAKKPGTVTIEATDKDGIKAKTTIKVLPFSILLDKPEIVGGDTANITINNMPKTGEIKFTVNNDKCSVDGNAFNAGVFDANTEVTITATYWSDDATETNITATASVKILTFGISINKTTLNGNETATITIDNEPIGGVEFDVSGNGGTISGKTFTAGIFAGTGTETVTITATSGDVSKTINVDINRFSISVPEKVVVGETANITINNPPTGLTPEYTVSDDGGTFDGNVFTAGNFDAEKIVTITASYGNVSYSAYITIEPFKIWVKDSNPKVVDVNSTLQLVANKIGTISWESSDPEFATVDENGVVTGVKYGETTITAKIGDEYTASIEIEVKQPPFNLTIQKVGNEAGKSVDLNIGETAELLSNLPAGVDITYEHTGVDCIKIENNTVIALKPTKDPITITATRGEEKSSVTVKVNYPAIQAQPAKNTFRVNEKINITHNELDNSPYTYKIISDDGNVTFVDDVMTVENPGTFTIKATRDNDGATTEFTVTVYGKLEITAGDKEIEEDKIKLATGDTIKLGVVNPIGDLSNIVWNTSDEEGNIIKLDEKGNLTVTGFGTVTVTITDSDGAEAKLTIEIDGKGIIPKLPSNYEQYGEMITVYEKDGWKHIVDDLEYTDENGDFYYYYIVECDDDGNPIDQLYGDRAVYLPVFYQNGLELRTDGSTELSCKNQFLEEVQGQLPSTGGEGVTWHYVTGAAIIIFTAAAYVLIKRRLEVVEE